MKKIAKFLVVIMALTLLIQTAVSINAYAAEKKDNKVVYELKKGTLTIKGKGKMPKTMKFENNKDIKKVVIKKGVTSISNFAFADCKNLKEVKIANTVKEIGWYSFKGTAIKEITIPKSVKTMGNGVLINCNKLTTVTMPGSVKQKVYPLSESGRFSLMNSEKIKTVNFNTPFNLELAEFLRGTNWNVWKKDPNYKSIDGVIYSKDGKEIVRVPSDRTEIAIADGCETFCLQSIFYTKLVPDDATYVCCSKLEKVTIPETVKYIDDEKYQSEYKADYHMKLTDIVINSSQLTSDSVITLISNLKEMTVLDNFEEVNVFDTTKILEMFEGRVVEKDDFYILDDTILLNYAGDKEFVTIPNGIKEIAKDAFRGKTFKEVILTEGLEKISENAFLGCDIEGIELPNSLKIVEDSAFEATMLKKIDISNTDIKWGEYVFSRSNLEEVILPEEMTYIPKGMFYDCMNLKKINVPNSLKKVKQDAFYWTQVDVQDFLDNKNLSTIYKGAFGFTNWTELTIPKNVKKIGKWGITSIRDEKKKITIEGSTENYHEDAFCENNEQQTLTVTFKGGIKKAYTDVQCMLFGETKNKKHNQVEFQWYKVSDVDGYDVRICSDKKYKKVIKKVTINKNKTSKTIKFSKKYKKAYVKIRPYKVVNGKKVYGRWAKDTI